MTLCSVVRNSNDSKKKTSVENTLLSLSLSLYLSLSNNAQHRVYDNFLRAGCSNEWNHSNYETVFRAKRRKVKESGNSIWRARRSLLSREESGTREKTKNLVTPFGSSLVSITRLVPVHRVASRDCPLFPGGGGGERGH